LMRRRRIQPDYYDLLLKCLRTSWFKEMLQETQRFSRGPKTMEDAVWAASRYVGQRLCKKLKRPLSAMEQFHIMEECRSALKKND
jgi:hypothetical protein